MEETDDLLLGSIREFLSISAKIKSLSDIESEDLFNIAVKVLDNAQIDTSDIKQIQGQRFRSMSKLKEKLYKELQIDIDLNDLMGPSLPFVRKVLLEFVSRMGSLSEGASSHKVDTQEDEDMRERRRRRRILKDWMEDEWVHPELRDSQATYQAHRFPLTIAKASFKTNLVPFFRKEPLKSSCASILGTANHRLQMREKELQAQEGLARKRAPDSQIQASKLVTSNFADWKMGTQQLEKLRRRMGREEQAKHQEAQNKDQVIDRQENQSVFKAEVEVRVHEKEKEKEKIDEIKSTVTEETLEAEEALSGSPLEKLKKEAESKKKQYDLLIQELLQDLRAKRQSLDSFEEEKLAMEKKMLRAEEQLNEYKLEGEELKKTVEKKQQVLQAVESQKPVDEEISKLQADIGAIEKSLAAEVESITDSIEHAKEESERKLEALRELKERLFRIEGEYRDVCEEIEEKAELKIKVKINTKGMSRVYYNKKIGEIQSRWRETQREVSKIQKDLERARERTAMVTDLSDTLSKDIFAIMDRDKNRNEVESKSLREVFSKCQENFKSTLSTLEKINEIKGETQEYEMKVHSLSSNNYSKGIQKVEAALQELKREIADIKGPKGRKPPL